MMKPLRVDKEPCTNHDKHQHNVLGHDLVKQLYIMLRTCRIYEATNENYTRQLEKFGGYLAHAFERYDHVTLHLSDGYLFFNDERLRTDLDGYLIVKYLQETFSLYCCAGFRFENGTEESELSALFSILARLNPVEDQDNRTILLEEMKREMLINVSLIESDEQKSQAGKPKTIAEKRKLARKNFFGAISAVGEIVGQASPEKPIAVSKLKRVVHALVDQLLSDETYLLELTALKNFDDYTFVHSVDVCIYAVTTGMRLGFSRPMLAEIGFAAMFHDIGKTKIPVDLLNKPSKLEGSDWDQLRAHPIHGVRILGDSMTLDSNTARAMLVSFEHHKNLDGSGYPYINRTSPINLYSKIVGICDFFDAITADRKYQKDKVGFDRAINEVVRLSGTKFDPLLVKVFITMLGVYPTGTLLLLSSGQLAIVISNNPEDIFRPKVRIIADTRGLLAEPIVADLTDFDEANDTYVRSVEHPVDPNKYKIDISQFILLQE
ncbi:MAG: HD domain-containing protein [candidate division Zixibacteria bacterium]|nr:HD domain-containing protein [candidate division Zixibacteria bacterium]MBU1470150.1 HD domain-containing protein [candidate division Zixibacteria bacterium]MBU2626007.1 HD domain-containing protein [candidate division Zixibacteria bacterium]